jgi:hypothetical protein
MADQFFHRKSSGLRDLPRCGGLAGTAQFIVHLEDEQIYYPCSDELFAAIIEKRADTVLTSAYIGIWTRLEKLVREW